MTVKSGTDWGEAIKELTDQGGCLVFICQGGLQNRNKTRYPETVQI